MEDVYNIIYEIIENKGSVEDLQTVFVRYKDISVNHDNYEMIYRCIENSRYDLLEYIMSKHTIYDDRTVILLGNVIKSREYKVLDIITKHIYVRKDIVKYIMDINDTKALDIVFDNIKYTDINHTIVIEDCLQEFKETTSKEIVDIVLYNCKQHGYKVLDIINYIDELSYLNMKRVFKWYSLQDIYNDKDYDTIGFERLYRTFSQLPDFTREELEQIYTMFRTTYGKDKYQEFVNILYLLTGKKIEGDFVYRNIVKEYIGSGSITDLVMKYLDLFV